MKFDSNLAWKQASEAVRANRDVLTAIAGVFVLLPNLAFSLLFPQPDPPAGLQGEAALDFMVQYYEPVMPWMLIVALVQAVATLALLTLLTDRSRPTVGAAIKQGAASLFPYIAAQLLLGIGLVSVAGVVLGAAGLTGSAVAITLAVAAVVLGAVYAFVTTSLSGPVIVVEGIRHPLRALRRSWELTRGNALRILLFYMLVGIAFIIIMMVTMIAIGALLALVAGTGEAARIPATIISSVLGTTITVYFVAIIAAVHRQMAGPSADSISAMFE